jgi:mRNA-degrading endonuclease RelE of RelBE toxin-antitoxin system
MGRNQRKIRYRLEFSQRADDDLARLPERRRQSVLRKCDWLAVNAKAMRHEALQELPTNLEGLCSLHSGDRRILYWVHHDRRLIQIARIIPRKGGYRELKR